MRVQSGRSLANKIFLKEEIEIPAASSRSFQYCNLWLYMVTISKNADNEDGK